MRTTNFEPIPFTACLAMADCAARVFAEYRTANKPGKDLVFTRKFLREHPVAVLRYLWRSGDAYQRRTVAARVHIWMKRETDSAKIAAFSQRIFAREEARSEKETSHAKAA